MRKLAVAALAVATVLLSSSRIQGTSCDPQQLQVAYVRAHALAEDAMNAGNRDNDLIRARLVQVFEAMNKRNDCERVHVATSMQASRKQRALANAER